MSDKAEDSASEGEDFDICGACNQPVPEDAKALECQLCDLWYHIECEGIAVDKYELLEPVRELVKWFCKKCDRTFAKMKQEINSLKTRVTELETRMETKINDKISEVVGERMERDRRKNNLMYFDLPEAPNSVKGKDRETHDLELLESLGNGIQAKELNIEEAKVVSTFRLGKKREDGTIRPLCVQLSDPKLKFSVIAAARKLRNAKDWRGDVFIAPDLTKLQRAEGKKLRAELKERTDRGEENLMIRYGKIIVKTDNNSAKTRDDLSPVREPDAPNDNGSRKQSPARKPDTTKGKGSSRSQGKGTDRGTARTRLRADTQPAVRSKVPSESQPKKVRPKGTN